MNAFQRVTVGVFAACVFAVQPALGDEPQPGLPEIAKQTRDAGEEEADTDEPMVADSGEGDEVEAITAVASGTTTEEEEERRLAEITRRLRHEPSLDKLIEAALQQADADRKGAERWATRVRRSPLLPVVKMSVGYDLEHDESLDRNQEDPDRWGADSDEDLELQLTAQWDLSLLVFHPDELKVYNALANRAERRESIIAAMIGYYFERRQLQILLFTHPPADGPERIQKKLRIKELSALIDVLTGGLLARNLHGTVQTETTP